MAHDPVDHPRHYTQHPSGVECIAVTEHMNFCLGNAMTYIWRAGEKGDAVADLRKARWYLDREIARLLAAAALCGEREGGGRTALDQRAPGPVPPAAAGTPPRVLPRQNAPAAATAGAGRKESALNTGYRTEARRAVLARDWAAGRPAHEILATLNAMEGPPVRPHLSQWAFDIGVKRPEGWQHGDAISDGRAAARTARGVASWADVMAWAETMNPDWVLRGSQAERLAEVNELRKLEGLPAFVLAKGV